MKCFDINETIYNFFSRFLCVKCKRFFKTKERERYHRLQVILYDCLIFLLLLSTYSLKNVSQCENLFARNEFCIKVNKQKMKSDILEKID